ncbi:hypothetical protein BSQ33_16175 [Vibrio gazogenes]|uniref:Uncharacterized protein n=1 Tax=Vibrio gazogenes TaxID=687 RepID=A0A1Z2SJH6_VIBGA|nr:hypothetical protein BSQ33_16175 [Vibrio gazogenes]
MPGNKRYEEDLMHRRSWSAHEHERRAKGAERVQYYAEARDEWQAANTSRRAAAKHAQNAERQGMAPSALNHEGAINYTQRRSNKNAQLAIEKKAERGRRR